VSDYWYGKTKLLLYRYEPSRPHPFERIAKPHRGVVRARSRVYKRGETWFCETTIGGRVVHSDNTNHWRTIFDIAFLSAASFDHVLFVGHPIKRSWRQLVDKAGQP
jgi:hypothetical protein